MPRTRAARRAATRGEDRFARCYKEQDIRHDATCCAATTWLGTTSSASGHPGKCCRDCTQNVPNCGNQKVRDVLIMTPLHAA